MISDADILAAGLTPIAHAADVPAMDKLHAFFAAMTPWQTRRRDELRAWYSNHDAASLEKLRREVRTLIVPLLAHILGQGVREGVFVVDRRDRAARLIVSLVHNLDDRLAYLALTSEPWDTAEQAVAMFTDAVTELLGAPTGSVALVDARPLRSWFAPETDVATG